MPAEALRATAAHAGLSGSMAQSLEHAAESFARVMTPQRVLICGSLALARAVLALHG
jgi:folylpolyglutamate synthase/dihydropteroate synthase